MWIFPYGGEMVLIGDTYTEAAQIDLQNVPDRTNAYESEESIA